MWRLTVNFSANEISWILLSTNERARNIIDTDSVRLSTIQFFLHNSLFIKLFWHVMKKVINKRTDKKTDVNLLNLCSVKCDHIQISFLAGLY